MVWVCRCGVYGLGFRALGLGIERFRAQGFPCYKKSSHQSSPLQTLQALSLHKSQVPEP